ncbi:hypothetical protein BSKO_03169 [Bryopsis sp. KO-2023]|nr:hypothetical protein BSKO_03169 [Bryopsis sp. KO-2023]
MTFQFSSLFFTFFFLVGIENVRNAMAHRMGPFHGDTLALLKRQQKIWRSREPDRYVMKVSWICGACMEQEKGPFLLEIQDDCVRLTKNAIGETETRFHFFTMNGWFEMLISLAEAGEHLTHLEFDPIYGYPVWATTRSYGAQVELMGEVISHARGTSGR